jgi:hypothetical protein
MLKVPQVDSDDAAHASYPTKSFTWLAAILGALPRTDITDSEKLAPHRRKLAIDLLGEAVDVSDGTTESSFIHCVFTDMTPSFLL